LPKAPTNVDFRPGSFAFGGRFSWALFLSRQPKRYKIGAEKVQNRRPSPARLN